MLFNFFWLSMWYFEFCLFKNYHVKIQNAQWRVLLQCGLDPRARRTRVRATCHRELYMFVASARLRKQSPSRDLLRARFNPQCQWKTIPASNRPRDAALLADDAVYTCSCIPRCILSVSVACILVGWYIVWQYIFGSVSSVSIHMVVAWLYPSYRYAAGRRLNAFASENRS